MKPGLITFTGADDQTDIAGMQRLSERYPIEWALLFSPERQGQGRYPSERFLATLLERPWLNRYPREPGLAGGMHFAAHLCGAYARTAAEGKPVPVNVSHFVNKCDRMQVNLGARYIAQTVGVVDRVYALGQGMHVDVILQCDLFPDEERVAWLHDVSGGRGKAAQSWPAAPVNALGGSPVVGFAGGLRPGAVAEHLEVMSACAPGGYWIDMEVRRVSRTDYCCNQRGKETLH